MLFDAQKHQEMGRFYPTRRFGKRPTMRARENNLILWGLFFHPIMKLELF